MRADRRTLFKLMADAGACDEATRWVRKTRGSPSQLWAKCPDGAWRFWLLDEVSLCPTEEEDGILYRAYAEAWASHRGKRPMDIRLARAAGERAEARTLLKMYPWKSVRAAILEKMS